MANQTKNYRKFVATSVTAALVASAVAPAAFAAEKVDFKDSIPTWAKDAVDYLVGKEAISGYPDGTFNQAGKLTRAEAAKILALSLDLKIDDNAKTDFVDAKDHWASKYIAAIQKEKPGVIDGYNGKFDPNANITRQQMAKMVVVAYDLKLDTNADISFSDNTGWGADQVNILASLGVVEGVSAGKFSPNADVTRGQAAVFVHRTEVEDVRVEVATKEAKVTSVTAINAKQLVVKFSQTVDESSILDSNDEVLKSVFTIKSLDSKNVTVDDSLATASTATGELSEDGKTLTITASGTEVFSKRYDVTINGVVSKSGVHLPKYFETITATDTVAPTLVSVSKTNASTAVVKFSEPVLGVGTPTFKLADGTVLSNVTGSLQNNNTEYKVDLSHSSVPVNKDIIATFVGVTDYAGNLTAQNPFTTSFQKGDKDGVKPTVSSLTVVNGGKLEIKFSEALTSVPTVAVGVTPATVKKDSKDETKYVATFATPLTGLQKVDISNFADLSGEAGDNYSRLVNFSVDSTNPKLASATLVTNSKDAKQYLEVKFDEDVAFTGTNTIAVTGTFVKDYITRSLTSKPVLVADFVAVDSSKNTYRIEASKLFSAGEDLEGASYSIEITGASELVKDLSGNNGPKTIKASFTRGKDGSVTTTAKPVVNSVTQNPADNNKITVEFDKEVDGASATTVANYKVDGAIVENVTLLPYSGGVQKVTLTLKDDSNTFTGARYVTISNVKAKNGTLMDTYKEIHTFNENVNPLVKDAKLSSTTKIDVTFTEAVSNGASADFELYIGGTKAAHTVTVETVATGSEKSTLTITLGTAITAEDVAKGLSLKAVSSIDVKDGVGNVVDVPTAGIAIQ